MVTHGSLIAKLVQYISGDTVLQSPIDVKGRNYWRLAEKVCQFLFWVSFILVSFLALLVKFTSSPSSDSGCSAINVLM